jgi:hypothetical protein
MITSVATTSHTTLEKKVLLMPIESLLKGKKRKKIQKPYCSNFAALTHFCQIFNFFEFFILKEKGLVKKGF